jgi:hypothetical protein
MDFITGRIIVSKDGQYEYRLCDKSLEKMQKYSAYRDCQYSWKTIKQGGNKNRKQNHIHHKHL